MDTHSPSVVGTLEDTATILKILCTLARQNRVPPGEILEQHSGVVHQASEVSLGNFTKPRREARWGSSFRRRSLSEVRANAMELTSGGSGGNGGGGENGRGRAVSTPDPLNDAARAIRVQAASVEPTVTDDLLELQAIVGAELDGIVVFEGNTYRMLNARLKTEESLARKIAADVANDDLTIEQASGMIFDALRYTYILEESSYGEAIRHAIDALIARGYTPVRAKNFWASKAGYAGVNTVWRTETGQAFEVQFHTRRTIDVKEGTHRLYERLRALPPGATEFVKLSDEIADAWQSVRDEPPRLGELSEWLQTMFP